MKTRIAIGCLIQWYECDMVEDYIESLKEAVNKYDGEVLVDFTICTNQDLEKCTSPEQLIECENKIIKKIIESGFKAYSTSKLITIADYRRNFNENYCEKADVLMWGESDAILPISTFIIIDSLHQQVNHQTPKYLTFFATCKMWDDSWKPIEHIELTDKKRDTLAWYGSSYVMTKEEMNNLNSKVEDLDIRIVSPHKFNGCGLVISSEVIKSGVNIPKSVFFTHEDTSFQHMTNKVLGNIPQYIIKNILLVHNRQHPKKRLYIANESGKTIKDRRMSSKWYEIAGKFSELNAYNLFNPQYKSFSWEDVWKKLQS